jgi:hypothetical protein
VRAYITVSHVLVDHLSVARACIAVARACIAVAHVLVDHPSVARACIARSRD